MSILDQLNEDIKNAMKKKEKEKLSVLRLAKSAIKNAEITKKEPLSEPEEAQILNREIKQRKDVLPEYEKAGRTETVNTLKKEIEVLQAYLPEQLSEKEIREKVQKVITEIDASGPRNMGKVMQRIMPQVKGKADGSLVNAIVKELLSK